MGRPVVHPKNQRGEWLPKHTRFITAVNNVSGNSRRLWNKLAARHRREAIRAKRDGRPRPLSHKFTPDEFFAMLGLTSRNFGYLEKRLDELRDKDFIWASFKEHEKDTSFKLVKSKWVSSITYEGTLRSGVQDIEVGFSEPIADAIEHPDVFGKIFFEEADLIRGRHGLALFELIADWQFRGKTPVYPLDYLQRFFDTNYDWSEFNRCVIKPGVKAVNSTRVVLIKVHRVYEGRSVKALWFSIKRLQAPQLMEKGQMSFWQPTDDKAVVETVTLDDLSEDELKELEAATLDRLAEEGEMTLAFFKQSEVALRRAMIQTYLERLTPVAEEVA